VIRPNCPESRLRSNIRVLKETLLAGRYTQSQVPAFIPATWLAELPVAA